MLCDQRKILSIQIVPYNHGSSLVGDGVLSNTFGDLTTSEI